MSFIELVLARFTSNVQLDAPLEGKKTDKVEHELIQKVSLDNIRRGMFSLVAISLPDEQATCGILLHND